MPSAQQCAERLREQAYRTLLPQVRDLEQELQKVSSSLSAGVQQIERKLEGLSRVELPTAELVLEEFLGDITREAEFRNGALARFAQGLRRKETQEEILAALLESAQEFMPRTALFVVRGDRLIGWSSRGFSDAAAREISSFDALRSDCPTVEDILEKGNPVTLSGFDEGHPLRYLDDEMQGACCVVPLRVLERPTAVLIAGGGPTQNAMDAIAVLTEFTVLRLENTALKILYELTSAKSAAGQAPEAAAPPSIRAQAAAAAFPEAARETVSTPEPVNEPEVPSDLPKSEEVFSWSGTNGSSSGSVEASELIPPAAEPEAAETQEEAKPVPEEEKLHSDAKRFARLLVSEIKLYNEHHVIEGRENRDLYIRLKRDIDRSREMYEMRVSPNVSRKVDYFHDEIIRILGDNDPSTLGSDYPGPRVES